jgi:hypothetical protein
MRAGDAIAHSAAAERSRKPNFVRYIALINGAVLRLYRTASDERSQVLIVLLLFEMSRSNPSFRPDRTSVDRRETAGSR